MAEVVGGADDGGGAVLGGGVLAGGVVVGTVDDGRGGVVGSGAGAGAGTVLNTTSLLTTVVGGEVDDGVSGGAVGAVAAVGAETGAVVDAGRVADVVVVVAPGSPSGLGGTSVPAAFRSRDAGMVARVGATDTRGREAVVRPCVRVASREMPAQTRPAEMVPTTRNRSAFDRVVVLVPRHQSRSRSDAPGRPNGAFFPIDWPER